MGIKEIKELFQFLECDMPSKIFPDEILKGEIWTRDDKFVNKEEVVEYSELCRERCKERIRKLKTQKETTCEHKNKKRLYQRGESWESIPIYKCQDCGELVEIKLKKVNVK